MLFLFGLTTFLPVYDDIRSAISRFSQYLGPHYY